MGPGLAPDHERALVARARAEADSFRELYAHYFPRLYAYVAARVDTVQDAEDVVADTFFRAVAQLDRFEDRGAGSFGAWLFQIARHRLTDFWRQRGQHPSVLSLDTTDGLLDGLAEPALPAPLRPEAAAEHAEQVALMRQLVATLSPRRQEVIQLKFFAGLRNQEIAAVLGLDERTVASHLCRGLQNLHRQYLAHAVDPLPT
ncbi:MAG TPA: sigma-70 family RNA polymerase sigma factor [Chloroflexota bacterium]|nr:sigma-70 family RNA polymerase sigma factor [Chloroflexota bacterium]